MTFFAELRRRNVIRVAGLYIVTAWLLVQIADVLLPVFEAPVWVMKVMVGLLALGFLPALIFSWVFELTPEGLKREVDIDRSQSIVDRTARKLDVAVILLLLAVGAMVWFRPAPMGSESTFADGREPPKPVQEAKVDSDPQAASIAVLPFADLSQAGDQSYFSDGMSEEILNVLVKVKGLEVASRTSSFAFKGEQSLGIPVIAKQLGVRHVLEGSVRRAGGTIRITAQLIDADVDRHLWSETFDRPLTAENVFAIQDEIAQAIVEALVAALPADAVRASAQDTTSNLTAYDSYLRARALVGSRRELQLADTLLGTSLQQDPNYAAAWALRSGLQILIGEYTDAPLSIEEQEQRGIEYADRALALAPDNAQALAAKAQIRSRAVSSLRAKHDLAEIFRDFERSLEIDPDNPDTLNWVGLAWGQVGQLDKALEAFQRCVAVDPQASACSENEYDALYGLDRHDEAWQRYLAAFDRGAVTDTYTNFGLLARQGQRAAFTYASNQARYLPRWHRHDALYEAFRHLDADHSALLSEVRDFADREHIDLHNGYRALLLVPLGAHDLVPFLPLVWGEDNRRYRQSPEFKRYVRESGVLDYWREVGFPPTCQPVEQDDFRCD